MATLLIVNAAVVTKEDVIPNGAVLVEDRKIKRIAREDNLKNLSVEEKVDAADQFLVPGYIDLHAHGIERYLIDNGPQDLGNIFELMPKYGITGFLPTIFPSERESTAPLLSALSGVQSHGAANLGFHMESRFLAKTGAGVPSSIGPGKPQDVIELIEAAQPYRAIFSISPELEGAGELISVMASYNAPVFITHTEADVKQTQAAIDAGVRHATHFYNVFPCPVETELGSRPCGVVEAVLADPRVSVDFLLDGVHVEPVAVQMALQCKGVDGVCLITDSVVGAGLPAGRYMSICEQEIEIALPGGPARTTENSIHGPGGLAGSSLTMDLAVKNAVKLLGVGLSTAVRMASTSPARVLGLENQKGQIKEGFDADMIMLNGDLKPVRTWVGGECVYTASE